MKTKIWIDTDTGTWGGDVSTLRIVEIPEGMIDGVDNMTDSEIVAFGHEFGVEV